MAIGISLKIEILEATVLETAPASWAPPSTHMPAHVGSFLFSSSGIRVGDSRILPPCRTLREET